MLFLFLKDLTQERWKNLLTGELPEEDWIKKIKDVTRGCNLI